MQGFQQFPPPVDVTPFPVLIPGLNAAQLADAGTTRISYWEIDEVQSAQLLSQCRIRNTTLTGALAAALLQGTADTIRMTEGDGTRPLKISLSCGADTRKMYSPPMPPHVLSFHVSGVPTYAISFDPQQQTAEDLWALAQKYRQNIASSLQVEYPLAIAGYIGRIWANSLDIAASATPKPMTLSLTNWGALPLQRTYGDRLRLVGLYPAVNLSHSAFPCVIADSVAGKLTLTVLTHSNAIDSAHAELLMRNIEKVLSSMLQ
jgi:hypothetical protein